MGTVALVVVVRKEEGIGAVLGPHVTELCGIPERLVGNLWHADWVRRWACAGDSEGFLSCVVHVILVVGRVDVLAVPATDVYVSTLSHWILTRRPLTRESDARS